jgi:hypothetical protein
MATRADTKRRKPHKEKKAELDYSEVMNNINPDWRPDQHKIPVAPTGATPLCPSTVTIKPAQ